jgi:methionine-rich copper-binding protein CopC
MSTLTSQHSSLPRIFIACLLAFMTLFAPIASIGAASTMRTHTAAKNAVKPEAGSFANSAAPLAPSITATKVDSFPDPNMDGKAAPGETITYDVNIANGGPDDALGVNFLDTIDGNTTLVGGSLKVSPLAFPDFFGGAAGSPLSVGAPGVLANDTGLPSPTAVPIAAGPTTGGGTVTLNADGSFLYTPPASPPSSDTFTYTVTNGLTPNDTATVTISLDAAPTVTATNPTNTATGIAANTNIVVTFSEPVNATTSSFSIECPAPGNLQAFAVSGSGTDTITLNPTADLPFGTNCTVTVIANEISDVDANDPPDNMNANFVFSFTTDAAPAVTATNPTNGATGVGAGSNIVVDFNETVNATTSSFTIECPAPGNLQTFAVTGSGTNQITLNPNSDLPSGVTCTVTVIANQISDTDTADPPDNMVANFVFSFTTDAAPAVTTTSPTNGATDVASNTNIVVNFTEAVNATTSSFTIECPTPGNLQTFAVTGSGTNAITLNPNSNLPEGTACTVTVIANQISDTDSADPPDNMAANFVFSFTIDTAPSVTATVPTNGATQVANNTDVSVTFSEPVNVSGNWFSIVCATSGTHDTTNSTVTGGPTTFTINPTDFANGELCTATIFAAQIGDQDANDPPENMAANFVFSFTIDNPPAVTTTTPTNGATGVLPTTNITINFNESVNASLASFQIECPAASGTRAFALSASPSNTFTLNPTLDLPEGTICTVTVFANQITDTDAGDPPDNMVADFVFSFSIPPRAVDDARNATGNIRIQSAGRSGFSTLTNDIGPGITVTAFDATSLRGGQVTVAADGTLTYNPRAGFEGADSFNYTITNAAGSDVGTVNVTVAGMIWFINNSATACATLNGTCGRLSDPLTSLPAFEAGNGGATSVGGDVVDPEAGDMIFIYTGSGGYVGPVTFEANQRVIGQGAQQTLQVLSGITPATDSDALPATGGGRPSIVTGGFNVVSNNQLYGLNFDDTNTTAINSTANVGTFIIADIGILNDASNGAGIVLDDGGTFTATGLNTITTRSGIGLNVSNTLIGAGNITFRSITVGNATGDADPAQGILLNNTGVAAGNGGLIVTGNAGVCTEATPTCTGGRIQNTTGGDVDPATSVPGGSGISLRNTKAVSLTLMRIDNHSNYGIHGLNVQGFTISNSVINGVNGTNVSSPFRDSSIRFDQLTGTNSITNSVISGGFQHNILIDNQSGTSQITVSGNIIKNTSAAVGDDGFHLEAELTAVVNAFVTNNSFSAHGGDHFNLSMINTADVELTFTGNSFAGGHAVGLGQGMLLFGATFNGTFNYDVSNNGTAVAPLVGNRQGGMINVNKGSGTGTFSGRIQNNFIGNAAVANSGSLEAFGIIVGARGAGGSHTTLIDSNTIRQYEDRGIVTETGEGAAAMNATITNNTVSNFADATNSLHGIHSDNGILSTDTNSICMDIRANSVATAGNEPQGGSDIRLRKGTQVGLSLRIPGLVGTNAPAAQAKILADNPTATSVNVSGANFTGGAACTQPVLPSGPTSLMFGSSVPLNIAKSTAPAAPSHLTGQTTVESIEAVAALSSSPITPTAKRDAGNALRNSTKNRWITSNHVNALQDKKPRRGISIRPTVVPLAGETVSHSVGTLLAGKTVHIQFQVTVNNPYSGGEFVSNQGTVSGDNFADVLTDDPAVAGMNEPTLTPIFTTPNVSVTDAQANEPASGSAPMLFTISLSAPAPAGGSSVTYATADQTPPGPGFAVAGVDYTAVPATVLNFAAGEQFKTVTVNVLADGDAGEPDETFLLNLSSPVNAELGDAQAVGTIKQGNAAGTFLISELRTSGPGGEGDDFVEVYNNSDTPLTIAASDASAGYGLFKMGADCNAAPILIGTIPNGTVIPARGHFLFVGSAYSLGNYGGTGAAAGDLTMSEDLASDANVGLFNTSFVASLSSVTRLDAVGFGSNTGGVCDLLREGTTLPPLGGSVLQHSYVRDECGKKGNPAVFGACPTGGAVKDSNVNNDDFIFVDTTGTSTPAGQRLGAPGPQNINNPIVRNNTITTLLIDSNFGAPAPPNRVRDLTPGDPSFAANGTLSVRRRFVNNTGGNVTRLRFRIVDISSLAVPGGIADMRALTSGNITVNSVTDAGTCLASNGVATTPCTVTILGTTLEQPPAQAIGGAHNSTMSAGTITLATPLAPGASINLQFLLGVQQTGSFKFFFNIEALP